jgi:hypothetical protein
LLTLNFEQLTKSSAIEIGFLQTGGLAAYCLLVTPSYSGVVLLAVYAFTAFHLAESQHPINQNNNDNYSANYSKPSKWVRSGKKIVTILCGVLLGLMLVIRSVDTTSVLRFQTTTDFSFPFDSPIDPNANRQLLDKKEHPIEQLVSIAKKDFDAKLARQSRTLDEAVATYRKRYGIPPPPKFDIWYEFARSHDVQLIDEFDSIHEMLTPFWALEPKMLRDRVAESLGFDNSLMAILVRDGRITHVEGSNSSSTLNWHEESLLSMMNSFTHHLPDMNMAFNLHDEPRVILQHDTLSRMVDLAKTVYMPQINAHGEPANRFSSRPKDLGSGTSITEVRATQFNRFARQHTWSHSRLSCPPESPSRDFTESAADNTPDHALGDLGFIYNTTAFADICQTPSLRQNFGFFDRPNVFNIIQDLVPIFSQSKISSFQDILYPSPWYWAEKVPYDEKEDHAWEEKNATIYWRGSTTGGFSRKGGWRRQHRQRVVRLLNAQSSTSVLAQSPDQEQWQLKTIQRHEYSSLIDVAFSHIGQCDPSDCIAQHEFFNVVDAEPQEKAWSSRLLLDMDGNAFSGRFISFLRSKSLVMKLAIFKEWHGEWLQPWVHYVPFSLKGEEWLETVRYLAGGTSGDKDGESLGKTLAESGRHWANRAMRKGDMEVWFFRLLLE